MDEENKMDQSTDGRVFVDALNDENDAAAAPAAEQKPAPAQFGNDQQTVSILPPVNNQQANPMPPVNNQQVNPMPPVNNQQPNMMPPINNQQPNMMPPVNNQQPNMMPPVNNQPMNQTPMGQPMNQQPMGAPMQQQPNPLFSAPPQQEPPKKKKGGGAVIIILVIVLLLLLGAGIAVLFANGMIGPKKEIQLSKTSVKLDKGDEIVIMIENYDDDLNGVYLKYESEDPKIAKISEEYDDAFVIQGKKKGKTTVTVSGKGCETITINVTVKD